MRSAGPFRRRLGAMADRVGDMEWERGLPVELDCPVLLTSSRLHADQLVLRVCLGLSIGWAASFSSLKVAACTRGEHLALMESWFLACTLL